MRLSVTTALTFAGLLGCARHLEVPRQLSGAPEGPRAVTPQLQPSSAHDASEAAHPDADPTVGDAQPKQLFENSGACLEPLEPAWGDLGTTDLRVAANLDQATTEIALVASQSARRSWTLSLRTPRSGGHVLSLTKIVRADTATGRNVERTTSERLLDASTADLVVRLWTALVRRVQIVHSDTTSLDGTPYYFWSRGSAGATLSPPTGSLLQNTVAISEHLARFVEDPHSTDLAFIRNELIDAIQRTQRQEPCVRALSHDGPGRRLSNKVLQQTGLSLACGSLWRPQLNAGTLDGRSGLAHRKSSHRPARSTESTLMHEGKPAVSHCRVPPA